MAPTNQRDGEVPDGVTRTVFDSMFGYSNGGFGQSYNSGEGAHNWADRLRDYCDQVGPCVSPIGSCMGPICDPGVWKGLLNALDRGCPLAALSKRWGQGA